MTTTEAAHIFTENLYRLNQKVVVLIPTSWNTFSPDQVTLLNKILSSVKLSLDGVVLLETTAPTLHSLKNLNPSHILSFGVNVPGISSLYTHEKIEGIQVVCSEPLPALNDVTKKSLWQGLKAAFG